MKTIIWEVKFSSPPKTLRHCKKCGAKTEYISSGLFRVNAQQKSLDIWLVYRCVHCKTTWNLPIHSRINPKSISANLLAKFTNNDAKLALQYAMDAELLKRNGAETETPPYKISGEIIDFTQDTKVQIICPHPLKVRVSKIIRQKLSLSKKAFDKLASKGFIQLKNGADLHKSKAHHNLTILFYHVKSTEP